MTRARAFWSRKLRKAGHQVAKAPVAEPCDIVSENVQQRDSHFFLPVPLPVPPTRHRALSRDGVSGSTAMCTCR